MSYQLRPAQPQDDAPSQVAPTYNPTFTVSAPSYFSYAPPQPHPHPHPHPQYPNLHAPQPPLPPPPPVYYDHDGFARTQSWLAAQPPAPAMSPPAPAKTVVSEWTSASSTTEASFDRRTLGAGAPSAMTMAMPPRPNRRVCGIRRSHFYVIFAIGMFLLVVGIAVGLGVGLASRDTSAPTPTSTTSPDGTSTQTSPTPSFTGIQAGDTVACPGDNNRVYLSASTSKAFNIQCGQDYNSAGGAVDLAHMIKATLAECIDACSGRQDCVGVGYGSYEGELTCWMKSQLGTPNTSTDDWAFAQLQDMSDVA
ncbi:Uu.00g061450.m01.CDS01 [Anthostomella pinea]|uniref:Uu.00g061450.m01.CDS01 n=1 Tax=Anthostomella pinea TaxID=933095 RepID=A0AAI8VSG6_9PEZI|nr:Uu.00g061450.m01.CDS01 [Anthostomella pinea]